MISFQLAILPKTECRLILKGAARFLQILSIVLIFGLSYHLKAQVMVTNVTNLSESVVQTAINSASQGEEVQLPAGTVTWTSPLIITNNISLVGAGIGNTIIIGNIPSASYNGLIQWTTISNYTECELSGFTFAEGSQAASYPDSVPLLEFSGFCPVCRVTDCLFSNLTDDAINWALGAYGCIDHCSFWSTNFTINIGCYNGALGGYGSAGHDYPDSYGDVSWATPVQYGSTNEWIYIEYNSFWFPNANNGTFCPAVDCLYGTRTVFRFNSLTNMYILSHGTDSGGRVRSGRAFEIYGNSWLNNDPVYTNGSTPIGFRGGSGVIFSNTLVGYGGLGDLQDYRAIGPASAWGGANGLSPWDTNGGFVASGTFTGPTGQQWLTDSNANWTVNQWVGGLNGNANWAYEVCDVTQGGTNFSQNGSAAIFSIIDANDAHDIYYPPNHFNNVLTWTSGDAYRIYKIYASIDQPGRGQGDLLADNAQYSYQPYDTVTGGTNWPNEALAPWYSWNNTNDGVAVGIATNTGYFPNGFFFPVIIYGRDYYNFSNMPDYMPLGAYPLDSTNVVSTLPTFALTVVNGTGGGNYTNGASVSISGNQANTTANGAFGFWSGSCMANTNSASTTVTMPASNLTVTAIYAPNPPPSIWAVPGS